MSADRPLRDLLLERVAVDTAHAWVEALRAELIHDGREADGAWPGTLSEARARTHEACRRAAVQHAIARPDHDELDRAAHKTTAEARRAWRKLLTREQR